MMASGGEEASGVQNFQAKISIFLFFRAKNKKIATRGIDGFIKIDKTLAKRGIF